MPRRKKEPETGKRRTPGKKFRLFIKTFDEDGNVDESNCGWLSFDKVAEMSRGMSDAKIFTDKEPGHGSAEDWIRLFEEENPEWKISASWIREDPLRP